MNSKKILCLDMDNVLVDFASGIERLSDKTKQAYAGNPDDVSEWTNSARMTRTTRIERMNTDTKICVNPKNLRHPSAGKTEGDTRKACNRVGKISKQ
jgi:FMN phosphatase YigB (HAD superfamily)